MHLWDHFILISLSKVYIKIQIRYHLVLFTILLKYSSNYNKKNLVVMVMIQGEYYKQIRKTSKAQLKN